MLELFDVLELFDSLERYSDGEILCRLLHCVWERLNNILFIRVLYGKL